MMFVVLRRRCSTHLPALTTPAFSPFARAPPVMAEAVQAAIATALAPAGAIHDVILAEIKKTFEQGQRGDVAITACSSAAVNALAVPAVVAALKDKNSELSELVKSEYDRRADESFLSAKTRSVFCARK